MALAQFRKVYGKSGSGRFVVSEGIAPSTYLLPYEGLPTLYVDDEDDRFEILIPKGTIVSGIRHPNGDTRLIPTNYATGDLVVGPDDPAIGDYDITNIDVPLGCAQYDLYRPFDKGTSQGAGWITRGFVEWPLVAGASVWTKTDDSTNADSPEGTVVYEQPADLTGWTQGTGFDNSDLVPGDLVVADALGRPTKAGATPAVGTVVGKVVEREDFNLNFDDGMLSYMQLPSDPGALRHVYELTQPGPYQHRLGIRANLDVENVVGAVRVNLNV